MGTGPAIAAGAPTNLSGTALTGSILTNGSIASVATGSVRTIAFTVGELAAATGANRRRDRHRGST